MELVERADLLAELSWLLDDARGGEGRLALVGGEAGAGKTSLVRGFAARLRGGGVRLLEGACDPLSTPRPLAPFRDMAAADASVERVLAGRPARHEVLGGLLDELSLTTVLVVEDAHWADEATLDALRFLGRRVHGTRGLVIVTYRDDELTHDHGLRAVLGDLATAPGCRRLEVPPLTPDGVAELARGLAYEPQRLYRVTGGNPFYVTEVLAAPGWVLPQTVSDAVLARARRLSEDARRLLSTVSLAPGGLELSLAGGTEATQGECLAAGMLLLENDRLTFRHELARQAIEASMPVLMRRRLHAGLLARLERRGERDPARLSHHADAATDPERTLRYAVEAAREASTRGAHREEAAQYGRALSYSEGRLDDTALADLLEAWANASLSGSHPTELLAARQRVVELRAETGDRLGEGAALAAFSRSLWAAGQGGEVREVADRAVAVLEQLPESPELADAYAWQSQIAMFARRARDAVSWGRRAAALARRIGEEAPLMNALIAVGATEIISYDRPEGVRRIERALGIARASGDDQAAMRALVNAGSALGEARRYEQAIPYLERALTFSRERDIDSGAGYALAWQARVAFEQGRWDEARDRAEETGGMSAAWPIVPMTALTVRGRLRARRGLPGADELLDRAWRMSEATGDLQRLWPCAAGRAELAWHAGRIEDIPALVAATYDLACELELPWAVGELAFWLWRAAQLDGVPETAAAPYALHMAGSWRAAADAWERIGCPYERAEALADGDEGAKREALEIFTQLGAEPAAARLRREMRRAGLTRVPGSPRTATRQAPAQLTARQLEVLGLVAEGQTNAEIAERLYITEKTAGHHVSAILRKLGVRTRTEAAAEAHRLGIPSANR
jgi:DNA-binding CsgD family transcriptional regulator/tetratricopeptide (TPR) repeat protein